MPAEVTDLQPCQARPHLPHREEGAEELRCRYQGRRRRASAPRRSLEFPLVVRHRLNAVGKVVELRLQRVELPHDFKNRGRRLDRNVLLRCPTLSNGVARVS